MKSIKELADIGRISALKEQIKTDRTYTVDMHADSTRDEPARQAFAAAVKEAVLAELVTKSDSSPTTKTVPLGISDIRATDEFQKLGGHAIYTAPLWDGRVIQIGGISINYEKLAANYLRRQHGSNEWKPCTKEEVK